MRHAFQYCSRSLHLFHGSLHYVNMRTIVYLSAICMFMGAHARQLSSGGGLASSSPGIQRNGVCDPDYPGIPFNWRPVEKVLALTFDDGPHVKHMTAVLDILKAENIPATFFVNTEEHNSNPIILPFSSKPVQDVLRRLLSEGHELGSHAAQHVLLTKYSAAAVEQQLQWAIGNISSVTGQPTVPLFRAPYADGFDPIGITTPPSDEVKRNWKIVQKHHVHVGWSFDGRDWNISGSDPGCVQRLSDAYGPPLVDSNATGVVLMHATPWGIAECPEALLRLVRHYKASGYSFVKVSSLVQQLYGMSPEEVVQAAQACPRSATDHDEPVDSAGARLSRRLQ